MSTENVFGGTLHGHRYRVFKRTGEGMPVRYFGECHCGINSHPNGCAKAQPPVTAICRHIVAVSRNG